MAQAGRLTWLDLEIPQASATTFAKSGGFTSPLSTSSPRGASYSRDGGISTKPWATDAYWRDYFERVVAAGGWGNADLGGGYTLSGAASGFSVSGGQGLVDGQDNYFARLAGVSMKDGEVSGKVSLSALPASGTIVAFDVIFRAADTSNWYGASIRFISDGRVDGQVRKFVGGSQTVLMGPATGISTGGYTAGAVVRFKAKIRDGASGPRVDMKFWLDGSSEPSTYAFGSVDAGFAFTSAGPVGLRINTVGVTNSPQVRVDEIYTYQEGSGGAVKGVGVAKSGGTASAGSVGGTKAASFAKTGGDSSPGAVGPGVRAFSKAKAGGITVGDVLGGSQQSPKTILWRSPVSLGGTKAFSIGKLGGISTGGRFGTGQRAVFTWLELELPTPASMTYAKAGGISMAGRVGFTLGLTNVFSKNGGTVSGITVGGSKLYPLWDDWSTTFTFSIVAQPAKAGGVIAPVSFGGAKIAQALKTAGTVSPIQVGGVKGKTVAKDGGISTAITFSGTKSVQALTGKLGGISTGGALGASRAFSVARVGGTLSTLSLGATKAYSAAKTGGISLKATLKGDQTISTAFGKTGGLFQGWSGAGDVEAIFTKSAAGFRSPVRFGAGEIYKRGGTSSQIELGGNRTARFVRVAGTVASVSLGFTKQITFTKSAAGIVIPIVIGADQANRFPRDGGIETGIQLGGSKFVPLRNYPVVGGFSTTITVGAISGLQKPRTGGIVTGGRFGDKPTISIRSAVSLGGIVGYQLLIRPGSNNEILSVIINESVLLSVSDRDDQGVLVRGKL